MTKPTLELKKKLNWEKKQLQFHKGCCILVKLLRAVLWVHKVTMNVLEERRNNNECNGFNN